MNAEVATNPWDYLLCLEGTTLWASAAVRVLNAAARGTAAFPFTTNPSPVGHTGLGAKDRLKPKDAKRSIAEMWLPIWSRPSSLDELKALLSEGRVSHGSRPARTGVDFARAVVSLGVDRGIDAFHRVSFLMRNGKSFFAASLGRFEVRGRPDADLLGQADRWLDRFAPAASDEKAPPRFRLALRRIEAAIFDFCQHGGAPRFAEILCALGCAERGLATGEKFREAKHLRPLVGLSPEWIRAANDGSFEFDLALSLAGIWDPEWKVGPLRVNLEPVKLGVNNKGEPFADWLDKDRAVVWTSADLATNLVAVLERRVMDAGRKGCMSLPLAFHRPASLDAIATFLAGGTDDARIEELLWGLVLTDHTKQYPVMSPWRSEREDAPPVPRAFALLKLLFLHEALETPSGGAVIRPRPGILPLLRAGRTGEACASAMRRLRSSGLVPMPHRASGRPSRDNTWEHEGGNIDSCRLAAALLFPVSKNHVKRLADLVLRPVGEPVEVAV